MNQEDIIKAGKIASETKKYARTIIKKGVPLLEIAEKIENKIIELGGKIAFPVGLSIDNIAAHATPTYNDQTLASGLIKIDLGVHINGSIADTAFSMDLENLEENQKLIQTAEKALEKALEYIKQKKQDSLTNEIGEVIEKEIKNNKFLPVANLSGHSMEYYNLHAGTTIPNIKNSHSQKLGKGLFACEPFVTNGSGRVKHGKSHGIYILENTKPIRDFFAREVLDYIKKEYNTLPFCSRWLVKRYGIKVLFALRKLEQNKNLHEFPELIEISNKENIKVSQAENTFLINDKNVIVTTI